MRPAAAMLQNCFLSRVVALVMLALAVPLHAQAPLAGTESVELRAGVIVDVSKGRLFLMRPDSAVEALDISTGKTLWTSKAAAKPLALKDGLLLSQAESTAGDNQLDLVMLDVEKAGQLVLTRRAALPQGVIANIDNTLSSRFSARSLPVDVSFYVSWEYQSIPLRGLQEPDDGTAAVQKTQAPQRTSGTLRMEPRTGTLMQITPADVPRIVQELKPLAITPPLAAPPTPNRRVSADGRHTLISSRIGDDTTWEKYRWSIVDNQTGKQIGEVRSFLSQTPFVVRNSLIVYETGSYARRVNNELQNEPLKIRSVDLTSGKETWNRNLRDTAFRGPVPP